MRRILGTGDPSELGSTKLPQGAAHSKVAGGAGHHVSMMTLVSASNCVSSHNVFFCCCFEILTIQTYGVWIVFVGMCVRVCVCAFVYEREI